MLCNMSSPAVVFKVLIMLVTITKAIGFCPSKCSCESEGDQNLRASCINAGLEVVPIQLNPDVKSINLAMNKITNVHFTLTFYVKLQTLDLSKNLIDTLGSKNFEFQNDLKVLNLSENSISALSKDTFRGLKHLVLLNLSDNIIETIHETAMHDLTSLQELDLTNNKIMSFEELSFRHLYSLEILTLQNNQILDVPSENLVYLRQLKQLDLSKNLVEFVKNDSFQGLKELLTIKLNENVISDLEMEAFNGLVTLRWLDLADNNLTMMPTLQLSKLSNLTNLSLSGNSFSYLPPVALLNLFHLRELQLDRLEKLVKIDSRAFVDNTFLQAISLDDNLEFADLPPRLFHGNPNLIDISMKGNALRTLDAAQFPLDRLHRLQLANNPFDCNCSLLWLWRLTTGQEYNDDDDDDKDDDGHMQNDENTTHSLVLDKDEIGCDVLKKEIKSRKLLKNISEGDMLCPAHFVTIICAVLTILVVIMTGVSVICYFQFLKRRKKVLEERKNVNERIVPQQVDKLELERYLAAQALTSEYRTLRPWELPIKEAVEEPDHYEKFDYFDRRTNKPHVVYV